ncbi:hypothetical protein [Aeromicrobium sp. 179-A 4D2 NHS]|uniref:hypothetical protein n=1 Tax=Aeromicrobium sp. 179-A 4D2 NHS TaxID=3142375 RepID=UPI0039A34312
MMERRRNAALYFLNTERDDRTGKKTLERARADQMRLMEGGLFTLVAICSYGTIDPDVTASNVRYVGEQLTKQSKRRDLSRERKRIAKIAGECLADAHVRDGLLIVPIAPDPKWRPVTVMFAMKMMVSTAFELAKMRGTRLPEPTDLIRNAEVSYKPDLRRLQTGS